MVTTRNTRFCKWLRHLGAAFLDAGAGEHDNDLAENIHEEEGGDNELDVVDNDVLDGDVVDEFIHLNLTGGIDTIADDDIFVLAEGEGQELNSVDGS